ncbi:prepilin peptidase [Cryptosporangium phraense]|uniref:prepilin peptidase n=1 Tax=Cryptosporangium phraense TaxID=2593070 RepID=UPI001F111595|nr:A24 family peptidase [Cryptosporangium phraense]
MLAGLAGLLASPLLRREIRRYGVPGPRLGSVEALAAASLALVALVLRGWPLLAVGWLVLIGVALVFVDLAVQRLPNRLTAAAVVGVLVLLAAAGDWRRLGWAVVCGLAACACYFVLAFASPAGLGMGDVKLAGSLGLTLGWWGGIVTMLGIAAGFFINGIVGVALLALRKVGRTDQLPHGPAMLLGALCAIVLFGG